MSGVTIGWTETAPASGDAISLGPSVIQSIQSSVRYAMGAEHIFPSSGGLAGAHQHGSAMAFYGPKSQVSSADTTGRIMVDNTNGNQALYYVGSDGTYPLGGRFVPFASLGNMFSSLASGYRVAISVVTQSVTTCLGTVQLNGGSVAFNGVPFFVNGSMQTTGTAILTVHPYYFNHSASPGSLVSFYLWDTTNQQSAQGGFLPAVLTTFAIGVRAD